MSPIVIMHYVNNGGSEDAFYKFLVPKEIAAISEEAGVLYRRQGDIFAAKFCGEQYFETRLAKLLGNRADVYKGSFNVMGTRHEAKGLRLIVDDPHQKRAILFKGNIEAPDHKPLVLDDALYLLGQTNSIVHPQNAD